LNRPNRMHDVSTVISPEVLAQRLEAAARHYESQAKIADDHRNPAGVRRMAVDLRRQVHESLIWAGALRGMTQLGMSGDDIEVIGSAD
jgi:hypothetical protein